MGEHEFVLKDGNTGKHPSLSLQKLRVVVLLHWRSVQHKSPVHLVDDCVRTFLKHMNLVVLSDVSKLLITHSHGSFIQQLWQWIPHKRQI